MATEAKVGALFLATIILIAVTAVYLGQYTIGAYQYDIVVHFADVKGLQPRADASLAGVKIGRVTQIALEDHPDYPERPVAVHLAVNSEVNLYNTDQFLIEQGALIGEQYLSVRRPTQQEIATKYGEDYVPRALAPGEHCAGSGLVGFAGLADQSQQLVQQAQATLDDIRATFADREVRQQVHQMLVNINRATAQANKIADQVLVLAQAMTRTGQSAEPQIARILDDVGQAAAGIRETSEQIRLATATLAASGTSQHIALTASNIAQASEDIKVVTAATRQMIGTPETKQQIQATIGNLASASESLSAVMASAQQMLGDEETESNFQAILANLRQTTENLQVITEQTKQLVTEESNIQNIQASLENLRVVSEQGVEVTRKADEALDRVDLTMDRLGELAGHFQPRRSTGYLDLEATDDRGLRTDLNFRLQYGEDPMSFWQVGIRDIGDHEALNLQKAMPLSRRSWARMGLIQSKVGAGLDYRTGYDLTLQLEAYDPNDVQLDLRGIYQFRPNWSLLLGVADSLGEKDPFIGLRQSIAGSADRKDKSD